MAPPPKRVDSAQVHNTTGKSVSVVAIYEDIKEQKDVVEVATVEAGAQHVFPAKELDFGSYKAVAPIKHLKVQDSGYEHVLELHVVGVVKVLSVSLVEVDGKPQLKQH